MWVFYGDISRMTKKHPQTFVHQVIPINLVGRQQKKLDKLRKKIVAKILQQ